MRGCGLTFPVCGLWCGLSPARRSVTTSSELSQGKGWLGDQQTTMPEHLTTTHHIFGAHILHVPNKPPRRRFSSIVSSRHWFRLQKRRAKGHHLTQKSLIGTRLVDHNDNDRWNEERQNKRSGTREASRPLTAWYA
ncbi:hypothetical protein E2C01_000605 [Portunus trituberculatus]|uniref:Uncharacterized protein n=1 Tax=Portunus trituberculatus TaxID=210409 RepID=A0A5B7CFJ0_PORTR|nr:hypothetical protein [Portunus trituberculatus]